MEQYNVFISHAWKYSKHYKKVEQWLNDAQHEGKLAWENYSKYEEKPLVVLNSRAERFVLQEEIDKQISLSSVVVVLAGLFTENSEWISHVVDSATAQGKYIIGIEPWNQGKTAKKILENANVMVPWDKEAFVEAIKKS